MNFNTLNWPLSLYCRGVAQTDFLSRCFLKKHLPYFQILTSTSPESPRTQDSGPSTTESKLALFRLYFFTMQRKRLKWLCFIKYFFFNREFAWYSRKTFWLVNSQLHGFLTALVHLRTTGATWLCRGTKYHSSQS